ncbi:Retrovirus-related Pol polyprotein from type-1 retrotransposable element R2 [Apis cerana cerana]|uniref:Retrovirus-related Pol polyprotein from type-1 retrotransposable element R2 n=1 Tax=Apis cerana cerana TaxID=94128 RepID=A0A2A3E0D0_APICC|nr:Retrovirus-related Pol polyprotein from type-1 retrotransposable element R2 [Apis cerana cerana]
MKSTTVAAASGSSSRTLKIQETQRCRAGSYPYTQQVSKIKRSQKQYAAGLSINQGSEQAAVGYISLCRGGESNTLLEAESNTPLKAEGNTPLGAKSNTPLGAKSSTPLEVAKQCAADPGNKTSAAVQAVGLRWLGLYALAVGRAPARSKEEEVAMTESEARSPSSESSEESIYESATEDEGGGEIRETAQQEDRWQEPFLQYITSNHLDEGDFLRGVEKEIERLAPARNIEQEEVDVLLQKFVDYLKEGTQHEEGNRQRQKGATKKGKKTTHNRRKRFLYAKHQELYRKCPRKLLDLAIMGESGKGEEAISLPGADSVGPLYKNLWGQSGPEKLAGLQAQNNKIEMGEIWTPITMGNLLEKFKKIKIDTAAGIDQIKKLHLRRKGALHVFAKLCNFLMLHRIYPAQWKVNRTTLIPKPGKSAEEVENWRPITIGSLLGRIYSAMIDRKLRSKIKQHPRQQGFTQEDGCKNNIAILSSALAKMKDESGGVITVIDISKAFDTVPHEAISKGLETKGVPSLVSKYTRHVQGLQNSYTL